MAWYGMSTGDVDCVVAWLVQVIAPLMMQFKEVEACLECSAKRLQFVEDVFYYALKAVIHPTAPLFDTHTSQLKPACIRALKRIFMLCDMDGCVSSPVRHTTLLLAYPLHVDVC
jgi:hypothetical protein